MTLQASTVQLHSDKLKLTEDLLDRDEQIAILTKARDALAKEVAELRIANEQLEAKNREQARVIELRDQENPRLAEIISQKEALIQDFQRKLEDMETSLTAALKRTQSDLSAEQYIQEIANSQESILKAHNQLAYFQNLLNDRDRALSTQRPDYSLYKSIGYQEAMSMWEVTKRQLQHDLDDRIQKVVLLEIEVDEAHESYRRLSEQMREISAKDAPKVSELQAELEKLQRSFQKLLSDQSKYQVQVEVLERKLKRKSEKRREAEEQLREMSERLADATHALERRSSEVTELRLHGGFARSVMGYNSSKLKKLVKGGASNM
jgi:chromosome segregation ATPase